jgi:uncharacterized protein YjbI with pentapeptide repeats
MRNTSLIHADMRGASFKGADLGYSVMDYADLRAATMMVVQQSGVSMIDHVTKGDGFGGVDFSNSSLRNASFGKAQLERANFNGALLLGTSFRGAKLSDATFTGAVLMGVNITEINLPREVFADCVFDPGPAERAKAEPLKATVAAHAAWVGSDGKEGAAAVLDGEDLRVIADQFRGRGLVGLTARCVLGIGVDFGGCHLQGAKFDGADLRGASFHGAKLGHVRFDKARLGKLQLRNGETLAPNFSGAEVSEEQFVGSVTDGPVSALGVGVSVEQ